ncbi:hypothetical protein ACRARG_03815 [Pseudooceanicola sp. C21-150M6]|uniref:hypothetical protein n=1 Tax=Pseudooceanicola sp. C21-150M6 TaxID=3434355 RepID=UPI003D7F8BC5
MLEQACERPRRCILRGRLRVWLLRAVDQNHLKNGAIKMTLITKERETSALTGHIEEIVGELCELKSCLRAVQDLVRQDDPGAVKEALRLSADIRGFLKNTWDLEARINEDRRKELGIAGDIGFDLGAARAEIGCKLDRLRGCCGAGSVSG